MSISVNQLGVITDITFHINRPNFTAATFAGLFRLYPDKMDNETKLKDGLDICHGKGNELLKQEIKRMFVKQSIREVADFLFENKYVESKINTLAEFQQALFKYWSKHFNDLKNLTPDSSEENQKLGRLVGSLRRRFEMGEALFKPFDLDMKAFGIEDSARKDRKMGVDKWEMLVDLYYNANYDFKLEKSHVEEELFDTALEFKFIHRC